MKASGAVLCVITLIAVTTAQSKKPPHPANFCSVNPKTGIPYKTEKSFLPADYLTGKTCGGDSNTPGSCWVIDWQAPGPVSEVTARKTGGFEEIYLCSPRDTVAHCEGWINGGNAAIVLSVNWKEPCD